MKLAVLASLALVVGVAAAGCGGDDGAQTPSPRPADDATETPPFALTFEAFESDNQGFRIEIPKGWVHKETPFEADGEAFVSDSFNATTPIDGELPNISVSGGAAGGRTVEEVLSAEERAAIVDDELVIAGNHAMRVDITEEQQGVLVDFSQVFVVVDETEWTLTLVVEAGNRDKFLPLFERVYNSFQPT